MKVPFLHVPAMLIAFYAVVSAIVFTGAVAIGFSMGAAASQPMGSTFWLEIAKTAIGAFLGAGLAFASTLCVQWWIQYEQRVAAGNVALGVLVQQMNDYLSIKKSMLRQRARALKARPDAPLWLHFLPSQYVFTEDRTEPASLAFLYDRHGATAAQKTLWVQHLHKTLAALVIEHRDVRVSIQQRQAELGVKPFDAMPMSELEAKIGPYLLARATSAAEALLHQFANDEKEYESAFKLLRAELRRRFGKRFIDMAPPTAPAGISTGSTSDAISTKGA